MDEVDELVDKIIQMKRSLDSGEYYKDIGRKYGVGFKLISDLKYVDNLENIRRDIERLKEDLNNGVDLKKACADLPYGQYLVNYMVRNIDKEGVKGIEKRQTEEYAKKVEHMWRNYKSGEAIEVIARESGSPEADIQCIVDYFEKRINQAREVYVEREKQQEIKPDSERKSIKKCISPYLSEDVIDYILYGKPIRLLQVKKKEKNLGDVDSNEL